MQTVSEAIKKGKTFLVCSHIGPDGDAMASMLAMGLGLEQMGKKVFYYNQDGVPESLRFLPGAEKVVAAFPDEGIVDLAISTDCGSLERLGERFAAFKGYQALLNVDHHASNDRYGQINYVLPDAASTGEVVWKILSGLNCKLNANIATNIFCTLVADTGSFRYSNTQAGTLRLAADMVEAGASPSFISQNLFESQPLVIFELLSRLLKRIKLSSDGRYSWSVIYQKDLKETGTHYEMTEEFINYPRAVRGVEVAALYKELTGNQYKVSLRSKSMVDVSAICQHYGGGGHKKAAACVVRGKFEEVWQKLSSDIQSALTKQHT